MIKHIILDFDGVIADTFDFHLKEVKNWHGKTFDPEEYRVIHEGNFYQNTSLKLEESDYKEYANFVSERQALTTPFPGALEFIREYSLRYPLHLVTSGWEIQIVPFLKEHSIVDCFNTVMCADHGLTKHEKLSELLTLDKTATTKDYIFVTDTLGDLRESNQVGIPTIAVTFGFHDRERLEKGGPAHIVDSWSEITQIIETNTK